MDKKETLEQIKTGDFFLADADDKLKGDKEVLDQEKIPEINSDCEKCIYLNTNKYYIE